MADILHFLEFIIVCAFALLALFVVLLVVVSKMPRDNPLRMILSALSHRVGATAAVGALAIPIEQIPGLDAVYYIGARYSSGTGTRSSETWVATSPRRHFSKSVATVGEQHRES